MWSWKTEGKSEEKGKTIKIILKWDKKEKNKHKKVK